MVTILVLQFHLKDKFGLQMYTLVTLAHIFISLKSNKNWLAAAAVLCRTATRTSKKDTGILPPLQKGHNQLDKAAGFSTFCLNMSSYFVLCVSISPGVIFLRTKQCPGVSRSSQPKGHIWLELYGKFALNCFVVLDLRENNKEASWLFNKWLFIYPCVLYSEYTMCAILIWPSCLSFNLANTLSLTFFFTVW